MVGEKQQKYCIDENQAHPFADVLPLLSSN
jgi:hypothetical protein